MKKQKEEKRTVVQKESKWYREKIVEMAEQIEDGKFLNQIYTILKKHIEKRGG